MTGFADPDDEVEAQLLQSYRAAAVAPDVREAARRRAAERAEEARLAGVYERALQIAGTIQWSMHWTDLRVEE